MYYTIYKITNNINNKIYIGSHKTSNLNDDYMGSGKHLKRSQFKYGIENFDKEIIFRAVSSDIMYWIERMLVDEEFVSSEETYNLKVGGNGGFDYINNSPDFISPMKNKCHVKDNDGVISTISIYDERYLTGEFVHIFKNTVSVIDENGNRFRVDKLDKRYLSGVLKGHTVGYAAYVDLNGNIIHCRTNDDRVLNGELTAHSKGRKLSSQTKSKMSAERKTRRWITNGLISKFCNIQEVYELLNLGWVYGRTLYKELDA